MKRFFIAGIVVALACVMLAVMPAVARADGATVTPTITMNGVMSFPFTNPCTGETGIATGPFHVGVCAGRAAEKYVQTRQ